MVTLIIPLMLVRVIEATKIFGGTEGISGLDPLPNAWFEGYLILLALNGFSEIRDMLPKSKVGKLLRREIRDEEKRRTEAG